VGDGRLSICIGNFYTRRARVAPGQPLRRHSSGFAESSASIVSARNIYEQRLIEMLLDAKCRDARLLFSAPLFAPYRISSMGACLRAYEWVVVFSSSRSIYKRVLAYVEAAVNCRGATSHS
jgi:hypothetical protein